MSADLPRSARRVHEALVALGLHAEIHRMADSTRTAPEVTPRITSDLTMAPTSSHS